MVSRSDGTPLLMDFGIAHSRAAATLTQGQLLATLDLCCPEYFIHFGAAHSYDQSRFDYTPASDVFCLGATFLEVLTGALPYQHILAADGHYLTQGFLKALDTYEPLPPSMLNPELPPEIDPLFVGMMQANPTRRFATAKKVSACVEGLLAAHPAPHPKLDVPFVVPPRKKPGDTPTRPPKGKPPFKAPTIQAALIAPSGAHTPPPLDPVAPPPFAPAQLDGDSPEFPSAAVPAPSLVASQQFMPPTGGFRPPTVAARAQGFMSPLDAEAQAPSAQSEEEPGLNTQLRKASAFLEGGGTPAAKANKNAIIVLGGLALVVLLIVGLAFASAKADASSQPQAVSLIDAPVAGAFTATPAAERSPALAPAATPAVEPVNDLVPLTPAPLTPPNTVTKGSVRKGASADQRAVDALLAQEYGGQRPTLNGNGTTPPQKSEPPRPSWLHVSTSVTQPTSGPGPKLYGVPLGTEVAVRLAKPLDSRTIGSGPVIVKLARPLVVRGRAIFPSGAMAYGIASVAGGSRFDVRFSRIKLQDGTEVPFEGIAYDNDDKKPGLRPSSRIQQGSNRSSNVGEAVLKGAANTLLGKLPGSDGVDVARGAGQTVINQTGSQQGGGIQEALMLDAPADFTVFVSAAF